MLSQTWQSLAKGQMVHSTSSAVSDDLCEPFLNSLPITGASVTVVVASGARLTVGSSDATSARIDELQFELGEGPQWAATQSGHIVAITDVHSDGHHEWPVLGAALSDLSVGAVFCIPMRMGAVTLGVATLYCRTPRELTNDQRITALAIAAAIAGPAVTHALKATGHETDLDTPYSPALRREVHQATGIMLVQLDTTATIAYARLQAYAFGSGRTVQAVAHAVVTGTLAFDEPVS